MKKYLALSVVLLLASLPGFASGVQPSPSSQIRIKHAHLSGKTNKTSSKTAPHDRHGAPADKSLLNRQAANPRIPARSLKPRKSTSNAAGAVGFVSAVQIPMAGQDDEETQSVMGDFNGDGKKDVAKMVINTIEDVSTYRISVVLGNGDGTFQAAQLTSAPYNSDDPIVVGDVNGDGKDDIVVVHPSEGVGCDVRPGTALRPRPANVSCAVASFDVLISNGDGTFTAGNNYPISDYAINGGILTDVNGDGKLDILAVDSETPPVVVSVLGNGDGTFQAPTTVATLTGNPSYDIFFADFNGDGKLDFAGYQDNQLYVYLSTGSSFAAPVALTTSDGNYSGCYSTAGDLNGDGKPEIVSVNCWDEGSDFDYNTVTVYMNNGDGSFQTGFYYRNAGDLWTDPYGATIADMNGDGKNDLVVSDVESGMITVFLGKGDGSLIAPTTGYDVGGYPWNPPLIADFNGDGLLDILIPDDYYSFVFLPGYGDGTFRAAPSYFLPDSYGSTQYSYSVATGDFNGDGFPDVVVGQDYDGEGYSFNTGVVVYLSNPDGTLQPGVYYGDSPTFAFVTVGDFNGDGKLDIAATDYYNGVVQIFLNNGNGTFTSGQAYATDTDGSPWPASVITADFNKDGKLDLAVANTNNGTVGILFGNGDGTFGGLTSYSMGEVWTYSLAAADLNNDGYPDLAVITYTDSAYSTAILLNNFDGAPGVFGSPSSLATGEYDPEYVALGDVNGDGNADLVVSIEGGAIYESYLSVSLGNGDGTFQDAVEYPSSAQDGGLGDAWVGNVQLFDMNGDGKLDLVYLNSGYGTVGVMYGNGDGTFTTPVEFPTSGRAWGMALADVNNDGAMDVVTANDESGGVSVLLNTNGTGTQPNYTMTTNAPAAVVPVGSSATYELTLVGNNLYNGTITLSCTSGLPVGTACSFSPASVVAQGNVPLSTTLTVTTTGAKAALVQPTRPNSNSNPPTYLASLGGLGLFGLLLSCGSLASKKNRVRLQMGALLGVMLFGTMLTVGCSGTSTGPNNVTPIGSYTVVVTATGTGTGAPTHTLNLTLVVQ